MRKIPSRRLCEKRIPGGWIIVPGKVQNGLLEAPGELLGARWAHFGSRGGSEAEFERLLGTLGALLVALGPLRGPFGALLGPLGALLGTIFASRNARFEGL